ncbi:unnamed protein product [[Actinomadura] parvosata subsp. kistnae]|uniref:Uncharacterized protein n=1 Tax=Nonomuraea gerenzanensis TaxID=93944 RepID=A0A1M4EKS8_9ACTN|nr:hypothetical protein BN4615_P8988 [Nonomuraea gerenzanensis]SPL90175.1 unnamed protein product [Actinomadura parvosata subsp. kistnae]
MIRTHKKTPRAHNEGWSRDGEDLLGPSRPAKKQGRGTHVSSLAHLFG